jgi:hypothetical protein
MRLIRNGVNTMVGPSEWFTGSVYVDAVAAPAGSAWCRTPTLHDAYRDARRR